MIRFPAILLVLAASLLFPETGRAFNEIDQIGNNNFKPMLGCPNCHLRRVTGSGAIKWIGANLPKTVLRGADLRDVDMRGANFRAADLRRADLRNADISGADLRNADLRGADLSGANLFKANLTGVKLGSVKLCNTTMPDGSVDNSHCGRPVKHVQNRKSTPEKPRETANSAGSKWDFTILGHRFTLP